MKVFWAWQSDLPSETNQDFIKSALKIAVDTAAANLELIDADRPEVDHDTLDVSGAAEVMPIVFEKIANSVIFVADVTPVARSADGKPHPNANVMVEIGWSLNNPGWRRQIYVMNEGFGFKPYDLPFDIRGRQTITYSLQENANPVAKETAKTHLVAKLTNAVSLALKEHLNEVVQNAPTRALSLPNDPSRPSSQLLVFRHLTSLGGTDWTDVQLQAEARTYVRVSPKSWADGPPDVATIQGILRRGRYPYPPSSFSEGDYGPTDEDFIFYTIRNTQPRTTSDYTLYLEPTGEFWTVGSGDVHEMGTVKRVDLAATFNGWSSNIRKSLSIMKEHGASSACTVEVGFAQFGDVRLPNFSNEHREVTPRKPVFSFVITKLRWTNDAIEDFLLKALEGIFRIYGVPRLTNERAIKFVRDNDLERPT